MAPDTWDPAACQGSIEGWRHEPIHLHFRWQDTDLNPNVEPGGGGGGGHGGGGGVVVSCGLERDLQEGGRAGGGGRGQQAHNAHVLTDKGDMRNGSGPEPH